MKSVLISIRPEWCEKIASGEKTVEIRKTRPELEMPFKCYIYCTKGKFEPHEHLRNNLHYNDSTIKVCEGRGKVIGEFVCENIDYWHISHLVFEQDAKIALKGTCLTKEEVEKYIGYEWGKNIWEKPYEFFGWHISDLVIYEQPKSLREIRGLRKTKFGMDPMTLARPPQSWCYVDEIRINTAEKAD